MLSKYGIVPKWEGSTAVISHMGITGHANVSKPGSLVLAAKITYLGTFLISGVELANKVEEKIRNIQLKLQ